MHRKPRPEEWYQQVLDTAPDAMVIVGPDEKITFVNQQTERLFGYTRAELLGQTLETLVRQILHLSHSPAVDRRGTRRRGGRYQRQRTHVCPLGRGPP